MYFAPPPPLHVQVSKIIVEHSLSFPLIYEF